MVKSFIRGLCKWPSGDLAELLLAIKAILDSRVVHAAETKHIKGKPVASRPAK